MSDLLPYSERISIARSLIAAKRDQLAVDYTDDILLCAGSSRARETAARCGLPLFVVLRVLVPFWRDRGLIGKDIAAWLGVSHRTVQRYMAYCQPNTARAA